MENNFFKSVIDADDAPVVMTALYGPAHKSRSSTLFISFDRCRVHIYYRMLKVANNHRCILFATKRKIRTFT